MEESRTRRVLDSASPSSSSRSGCSLRRQAMNTLEDVRFVRLESCARRGTYLAVEKDSAAVCLRAAPRAAANNVWRLEATAATNGEDGFLLRGSYGHFLVASDRPAATGAPGDVIAEQRALADESAPPLRFVWKVAMTEGNFYVQNLTGRFLRANGRYLRWRRTVTVASDNGSKMLRWSLEVPLNRERLAILDVQDESKDARTKDELRTILRRIEDVKHNKKDLEQKKKIAQAKIHHLKSKEQRIMKKGSRNLNVKLNRIVRDIGISTKAEQSYDTKIAQSDAEISRFKLQEKDKRAQIEKPKWIALTA